MVLEYSTRKGGGYCHVLSQSQCSLCRMMSSIQMRDSLQSVEQRSDLCVYHLRILLAFDGMP